MITESANIEMIGRAYAHAGRDDIPAIVATPGGRPPPILSGLRDCTKTPSPLAGEGWGRGLFSNGLAP
jgi:hypothetical protein